MKIGAVLVGNTTVPEPLKGVEADLKTFSGYLRSNKGGAWESGEIIPLLNPTKKQVLGALQKFENYDYVMTLVAAHGEHRMPHNETLFWLDEKDQVNGVMYVKDLEISCKRQVLIVDVCRRIVFQKLIKSAALSHTLDFAMESRGLYSREQYRENYLSRIRETSHGTLTFYSCNLHESADESEDGGVYTQALLSAGAESKSSMSILDAHKIAKTRTTANTPNQHPTEHIPRRGAGDDYPPFSVVF